MISRIFVEVTEALHSTSGESRNDISTMDDSELENLATVVSVASCTEFMLCKGQNTTYGSAQLCRNNQVELRVVRIGIQWQSKLGNFRRLNLAIVVISF